MEKMELNRNGILAEDQRPKAVWVLAVSCWFLAVGFQYTKRK